MRHLRRWPLLLVLLTLAICLGIAWRIHEQGRPIEEAYARIQPGMSGSEVGALLGPIKAASGEVSNKVHQDSEGQLRSTAVWSLQHDYAVEIEFIYRADEPHVVVDKRIERPHWTTRVERWLGLARPPLAPLE